LAGFFSVFFASADAGALGAVSDFGVWANAVSAKADANNVMSSFFIFNPPGVMEMIR
jgi:hypothetical protein